MGFFKNIISRVSKKRDDGYDNLGIQAPVGYSYIGAYELSGMAYKYNTVKYKRLGFDVIKVPVTLSTGKQGARLYVKRNITIPQKTQAKSLQGLSKITKTKVFNNKRFVLSSVELNGEFAKIKANQLKSEKGWSTRVVKVAESNKIKYAIYVRAVEAEAKAKKQAKNKAKAEKDKEQRRLKQARINARKLALREKKKKQAERARELKRLKITRANAKKHILRRKKEKKPRIVFPEHEIKNGKTYIKNKFVGNDYDRAKMYRRTLAEKGYESLIFQSDIEGKTVYAVYVRR